MGIKIEIKINKEKKRKEKKRGGKKEKTEEKQRRLPSSALPSGSIRGTCIDLVFSNFRLDPIQEPLSLHFTYHKAVIMKGKRRPHHNTIYAVWFINNFVYTVHTCCHVFAWSSGQCTGGFTVNDPPDLHPLVIIHFVDRLWFFLFMQSPFGHVTCVLRDACYDGGTG